MTVTAAKPAQAAVKATVDVDTKRRFEEIAAELGLSASSALAVFVKRFVAEGGFPFAVKTTASSCINLSDPGLMRARMVGGVAVVPNGWRDDDDDE